MFIACTYEHCPEKGITKNTVPQLWPDQSPPDTPLSEIICGGCGRSEWEIIELEPLEAGENQ